MTTLSLTILVSMLLAVWMGPGFISYLRRWKVEQAIRVEGPQSHQSKAGTPTMGGWIIVAPAILTTLVVSGLRGGVPADLLAVVAVVLAYAVIGWLDDYLIIKKRQNKGLTARQKLLAQIGIAILFCVYLGTSGHGTAILLPFTHTSFDMGFLYYPFIVFVMAAETNGVNLTDGLDGLAAGTAAIAFGGLAWLLGEYSTFGALGPTVTFLLALVGSCMGFLWFNSHPAQVFMGDTGSLALGAAFAACAILGHLELFLIPLGGLFVAESLSVVLQVASFKLTGKRIFKMSPLHHHFELSGWAETKIVQRFHLIAGALAILTIGLF